MTAPQPSESPRRRWLSFSLRGAFVLLTIVCIWLGVQVTRARKQQQAVNTVQQLGGQLRFDNQADAQGRPAPKSQVEVPEWLREAIGEDYFRSVAMVDFAFGGGGKATDDDLAVFKILDDVRSLELGRNPAITDAGLEHLAGLTKLKTLYLYRTNVAGPGIRHLPRSLESLHLGLTPLGDEGLAHLKRLPKLKWLDLGKTAISDEGLADLAAIVTLEDLRLTHTDITDAGLEHLHRLKSLKVLSLQDTNVTGRGVTQLQQALPACRISPTAEWLGAVPTDVTLWPEDYQPTNAEILAKLKEKEIGWEASLDRIDPDQPIVRLSLMDSTISDESLLRLLAELPDLERLNLRRVLVGDRLAKGLPGLPRLAFLSLDESRITDDGLKYVGQITTLRELTLQGTGISDAGLKHLAGLKNLESLHASNTRATDLGRAKLRSALPKCRIPD